MPIHLRRASLVLVVAGVSLAMFLPRARLRGIVSFSDAIGIPIDDRLQHFFVGAALTIAVFFAHRWGRWQPARLASRVILVSGIAGAAIESAQPWFNRAAQTSDLAFHLLGSMAGVLASLTLAVILRRLTSIYVTLPPPAGDPVVAAGQEHPELERV